MFKSSQQEKKFLQVFLLITILVSISSCQQTTITSTPPPTDTLILRLYQTLTPTLINTQPEFSKNTETPPPLPSPTPVTYQVAQGDTMLGIAMRYGLSLEELQAANPGVNPRFLSVGAILTIPYKVRDITQLVTPSPVSINLRSPDCYPTPDEGLWCFILVENTQEFDIENVSAYVSVRSFQDKLVAGEVVIPPLNIITSRTSIPLVVYFPPPIPQNYRISVNLLSAIKVNDFGARYLKAKIRNLQVIISENNLHATITGVVGFPGSSPEAQHVWVLVVAYDQEGHVVGVRRWEAQSAINSTQTPTINLIEGGKKIPFELIVYSLGFGITRVEVMVEAQR